MEKKSVTLNFAAHKLEALEYAFKQEGSGQTVQRLLEDTLNNLYDKMIPELMRGFLDYKAGVSTKPKHPAKSQEQKPTEKVPSAAAEGKKEE